MKVADLSALPVHPIADTFPLVSDEELLDLAQDIATHGLLHPVVLHNGVLLDGRNRLAAALLPSSGIEDLDITEFSGTDPVAFILSANLRRRQLTMGQKAALALALIEHLAPEALERMLRGDPDPRADLPQGKTTDLAAEAVGGISGRTVRNAKALAETAPDLWQQAVSGEKSIQKATDELKRRRFPDKAAKAEVVDRAESLQARACDGIAELVALCKGARPDEIATVIRILSKIEVAAADAALTLTGSEA